MLAQRPRRNRKSEAIRSLCRETQLQSSQFVYPLFVKEGSGNEEISSMPGCARWSIEGLLREVERACELGISSFVFFPAIDDSLKSPDAEESFNDDGLIPRVIKQIKSEFPHVTAITDVALDPYSSDGHDGIVTLDGKILNDETVAILCRQAISHARAGADIVSPSDMMDGRVGAIRDALDEEGFSDVSILAYSAKYASAFYGPFRGALDSAPRGGDKKTYQMDPANVREALREVELDEAEGADMVMVKPAGAYLDVIARVKDSTTLPVAAYQVSGEYAMIRHGAAAGSFDEDAAILESLVSIKRAGADIILSYFAPRASQLLSS